MNDGVGKNQPNQHDLQIKDLHQRLAKAKKGLRNHQIVLGLVCVLWVVQQTIVYIW